ncbi:MAG TPA: CAP domain-containing protein [Steroidobacteraceae bacterium]
MKAMRCVSLIRVAALGSALLLLSSQLFADVIGSANAVRTAGCSGKGSAAPALRADRRLNDAAAHLARTNDLNAALRSAGYRAMQSVSMHIRTPGGDSAVAEILRERFCRQISDPAFREIGVARSGDEVWIILATPVPGAPSSANVARARVLELVNAARSKPRRCGRRKFAAAPPLQLVDALNQSARAHAQDMARHGRLNHQGSDGSTPAERLGRTGYKWRLVGENIASGPMTPEEVTAGWLKSPEHCANIMDPAFMHLGVGYAESREKDGVLYWVQVFAVPR